MAIRNAGKVLILNFLSLNKIFGKLKIIVSKSRTTHSPIVVLNSRIQEKINESK